MKAFRFEDRIALENLRLVELDVPRPGPREILVRMRAAAMNQRDVLIAQGRYGNFAAPLVPLSDGAGEVVEVGPAVTRFGKGDRVIPTYVPDWIAGPVREGVGARRLGGPNPGTLRELMAVHEEAAVRAPSNLGWLEAATLPIAAVTAWQVLFTDVGIGPGDVIAVQGTGGVALFVVQLARAAGAKAVVLLRSGARAARVEEAGAAVVDTSREPAWESRLLALTNGRGVDLFVDVVGGNGVNRAVAATRVGGTVALVGFVGDTTASIDLPAAIRRVVSFRTVSGGSRATFEALVRGIEANDVHPIIDTVVPFTKAPEAFVKLASGSPFGKVVIDFDG
ncbi:Alcohol dehydrogenase [Labilithrix luteola]|uniref:Alcohol dehydrogenase n=1 Tax=Labilithrix luteola TaxID=1391654 RepID=A0A0K1PWI7_9BACT|nr:NAD(P)-dependent alcohol dehydrogenase [Labilithrix luteola]AKU97504.1 Alcohol dehydrogenase [Labilithrix luteola]